MEDVAQGKRHIARRQHGGGHLVEQRLELLKVILVDQPDPNIRMRSQLTGAVESGSLAIKLVFFNDELASIAFRPTADRRNYNVSPQIFTRACPLPVNPQDAMHISLASEHVRPGRSPGSLGPLRRERPASPGTGHCSSDAHIASERERQAKTDACLVPLCPLASVHKYLRLCDLCKELAFGAPAQKGKVAISYNSFAFSLLCRQFLEKRD